MSVVQPDLLKGLANPSEQECSRGQQVPFRERTGWEALSSITPPSLYASSMPSSNSRSTHAHGRSRLGSMALRTSGVVQTIVNPPFGSIEYEGKKKGGLPPQKM